MKQTKHPILAALAATVLLAPAAPAQDLAAKFYKPSPGVAGYQAKGVLVEAPDGNLYGSSPGNGANGVGSIVRLTPEGAATTAYSFSALDPSGHNDEGARPVGGLILGHDGNLYGATTQGGAVGDGTVFQFTPAGAVKAIASFSSPVIPSGNLVEDEAGNFYVRDGSNSIGAFLKVSPAGVVNSYHVFSTPNSDGINAEGSSLRQGLAIDAQDNIYGSAYSGGNSYGTIFRISPGGSTSALYAYTSGDKTPYAIDALNSIVAVNGTVYGAGNNGGDNPSGVIFKTVGGVPTVLYRFSNTTNDTTGHFFNADGAFPGGLTLGGDGNLYGQTISGGANGSGTVFRLSPEGAFTLLYTFPANAYALEPPMLASNGDVYGHSYGDLGCFYRLGATFLPVFNAPTLSATATQGVQLSLQLVAANRPDAYTATGLPAGLSLDGTTGLITGATTAPLGVYPVALSATNSDGTSTAMLTITVQAPNADAPVINVPSTPLAASVGAPFSYQLDATNKPTSYQIAGLPEGVTVDPKTGLIHGLFANTGKILLNIQAQNASGTGTASLEIDVAPANTLPTVTAVVSGDANAATGQTGAFTIALSAASADKIIVCYTLKGSAVNGEDYALLNGTVKFKAGKTSKQVVITPLKDTGGPGKKTVKLTLQPGSGYTIGTPDPIKVKIVE